MCKQAKTLLFLVKTLTWRPSKRKMMLCLKTFRVTPVRRWAKVSRKRRRAETMMTTMTGRGAMAWESSPGVTLQVEGVTLRYFIHSPVRLCVVCLCPLQLLSSVVVKITYYTAHRVFTMDTVQFSVQWHRALSQCAAPSGSSSRTVRSAKLNVCPHWALSVSCRFISENKAPLHTYLLFFIY